MCDSDFYAESNVASPVPSPPVRPITLARERVTLHNAAPVRDAAEAIPLLSRLKAGSDEELRLSGVNLKRGAPQQLAGSDRLYAHNV